MTTRKELIERAVAGGLSQAQAVDLVNAVKGPAPDEPREPPETATPRTTVRSRG